jgi:uncharacterized RDD family membrane protein YckC
MTRSETNLQIEGWFWRRFGATMIDSFLVYSSTICLNSLARLVGFKIPLEPLFLVLAVVYGTLFVTWKGQTPGKILMGIRVALRNGQQIDPRHALLRELVGKWLLSVALPLTVARIILSEAWLPTVFEVLFAFAALFLILVYYILTKNTWYDLIARTTVVRVPLSERAAPKAVLVSLIGAFVAAAGIGAFEYFYTGSIHSSLSAYVSSRSIVPYTKFLRKPRETPVDYIMGLYDNNDIVILCERPHPEATQWELITQLVSDPRFIDRVGNVFTEYGNANVQPSLDNFMITPGLTESEINERVLYIIRNMTVWPTWLNTNFFTYLKNLYHLNQSLAADKRIHHYLCDLEPLWDSVRTKEDYLIYHRGIVDRDRHMAETMIDRFQRIQSTSISRKMCLVIMNYRHAFRLTKDPTGHLDPSMAEYVFERFPGRTANVLLNTHLVLVPIQQGRWDAAFEETGNSPLGFSLQGTPFGADPFDLFPFVIWLKGQQHYADMFTGFVFTRPIDEWKIEQGIPGYFDGFEKEALRRAGLMGEGMYKEVEEQISMAKTVSVPRTRGMPVRSIETRIALGTGLLFCLGFPVGVGAWMVSYLRYERTSPHPKVADV